MKFSLVMATRGRSREIAVFLDSLVRQAHKNHELIIVDQNSDSRVYDIYQRYAGLTEIKYIKSGRAGLSHNRNLGLKLASGGIVSFPDDDCQYDTGTLEKVNAFFENGNLDFYSCNTADFENREKSIQNSMKHDCAVTPNNFWRTCISFTLFIRAPALENFRFDENLGVGAPFGSAEDCDLVLYLLKNGGRGRYFAGSFIFHPHKNHRENPERLFSYGRGLGALYRKAAVYYRYPFLFFGFCWILLKNIAAIVILPGKTARIGSFRGRIDGFLHYRPETEKLNG